MREVRVYDRDFPRREVFEDLLLDVSAEEFPKEVWLEQVAAGEVAVRYKDFKTGLARNPQGEPVQSSEICRIFSSQEEAIANSKKIVNSYSVVRCFLYDHKGALVKTVSNNRELGKFALASYLAMLVWLVGFAVIGMSLIWLLIGASRLLLPGAVAKTLQPSHLAWFWWIIFAISGLAIGIWVWFLRISFRAKKRVNRMTKNLDSLLTPDDKRRFEGLNTLYRTKDPIERERLRKLTREYQEKIAEALKNNPK